MYRILTSNGSRTTTELVETAVQAGVPVKSLSVQNTTLDDVFRPLQPDVSWLTSWSKPSWLKCWPGG